MPEPETVETTIPFTGFYNSDHDAELDDALGQMTADDSGDPSPEADDLWTHVDWRKAHTAYSRLYVEAFNGVFLDATGIDLGAEFVTLDSPREYNFTTDRIFCTISVDKVAELYAKVDKDALAKLICERFTSRDGFISFYKPSLEAWLAKEPDPADWDHNQIGTIIEAFVKEDVDGEDLKAYNLLDDARGNGVFDNILWDAMDAEGKALVTKINDARRRAELAYDITNPDKYIIVSDSERGFWAGVERGWKPDLLSAAPFNDLPISLPISVGNDARVVTGTDAIAMPDFNAEERKEPEA